MDNTETINIEICPRPIFLLGSPRSGTSIFAWALAEHSDLWVSGEIQLFFGLFNQGAVVPRLERELKLPNGWFSNEEVTAEEFLAALGTGLNMLLTSRSGGRRWIEQTPVHTLMAPNLAAMFPGAQFVHILRDGRNVVESMVEFENSLSPEEAADVRAIGLYPPWASDFEEACRTWKSSVEAALTLQETNPERCYSVRYEELSQKPEGVLAEVFQFLGLPDDQRSSARLRATRLHSSHSRLRWGRTGTDIWRSWSAEQRSAFLRLAGELLVQCGYADWNELR